MSRVELDGDDWRGIGEPVGELAVRSLMELVADAPGELAPVDAALRIGADHLPLASLVALLAAGRRQQEAQVADLLGTPYLPSPFVLGITGGVAVGKSMAAGAITALLRDQLDVDAAVVTTDG